MKYIVAMSRSLSAVDGLAPRKGFGEIIQLLPDSPELWAELTDSNKDQSHLFYFKQIDITKAKKDQIELDINGITDILGTVIEPKKLSIEDNFTPEEKTLLMIKGPITEKLGGDLVKTDIVDKAAVAVEPDPIIKG